MEEKKDFTMMFKKGKKPEILSKEETIKQVVKALEEKKYNVVDQLTGYLLSGDSVILFEEKIDSSYNYTKLIYLM